MNIGKRFKEERTKKQLTQEQVAKDLNVSRSTISSWETGRTYPDLSMILAISDYFEISLEQLLREDEEVIMKLTNDSKLRKKQSKTIKILLLIFVPLTLFLVFLLFQSNKSVDVGYTQIQDATFAKNSESVTIHIKGRAFYDYSGYMIDFDESNGELSIELLQKLTLTGGKEQTIKVPISSNINKNKIRNVLITNNKNEKVFEIKKQSN